jgi:hypothetical protein
MQHASMENMTILSEVEEKKITLAVRGPRDVKIGQTNPDYARNLDFDGCCGDPDMRKCKK